MAELGLWSPHFEPLPQSPSQARVPTLLPGALLPGLHPHPTSLDTQPQAAASLLGVSIQAYPHTWAREVAAMRTPYFS